MFVVTLPASAAKNPAAFAREAKRAGAQILEVRGDITPKIPIFKSPMPILLSPRRSGLEMPCDFLDLEQGEARQAASSATLIASFHDYKKTPSLHTLLSVADKLCTRKPWAVKIATTVRREKDLLVLLELQKALKTKKIRSIVLGMGPLAHLTRVLSPLNNALTYACLDASEASADGQLSLGLYALTKNRKKPKLFGILGGPHVVSSLSPVIHNALFQRHGVDALYSCFPSDDLKKTIRALEKADVQGYSVTAPFKKDAFHLAKTREALVQKLGVANTLKRRGKGYDAWLTDAAGIEHGYPVLKKSSTVAILGGGGAVPSAIVAARSAQKDVKITIFARQPKKALDMLGGLQIDILPLAKAEGFVVDTVICAVSADVHLPMPHAKTAIDLRYGKVTCFLKDARQRGMKTHNGIAMLVHQALKQFRHFTGKTPRHDDAEYCMSVLRHFLPR